MKTVFFNRQIGLPVLVTLVGMIIVLGMVIGTAGGDALALARLGTRYSQGDPHGSEGYDGQFVYYLARNPNPQEVEPYLDVPAYRYQRILLPLLARTLSFGQIEAIPWVLAVLGVLSQAGGTAVMAVLLMRFGSNTWYALVYGLWVGFVLAVRLDLPEPLAYGLVAGGLLATLHGRHVLAWVLYALSLFSKEVALLFVLAQGLDYLLRKEWNKALGLGLVSLLPFALFQGWLFYTFGEFGLGSGGAMTTGFEMVPLMGLWRIGLSSWLLFFGTLVVFGPFVLFPAFWGLWEASKRLLQAKRGVVALSMFLLGGSVLFLPFSTFREPGGLLRYTCGLVQVVLLYAGSYGHSRILRYSPLWLVLNVFLLKPLS
ncbi:MAG: AZOBR_p60025 family cell surface glycopolymer formation protein [Chloroflexota bacterium]